MHDQEAHSTAETKKKRAYMLFEENIVAHSQNLAIKCCEIFKINKLRRKNATLKRGDTQASTNAQTVQQKVLHTHQFLNIPVKRE